MIPAIHARLLRTLSDDLDPVRLGSADDLAGLQHHEIEGKLRNIQHDLLLCQDVKLHLGCRWFCKLDLDDVLPLQVIIATMSPGAKGAAMSAIRPGGSHRQTHNWHGRPKLTNASTAMG
jgi:hypothetical protein